MKNCFMASVVSGGKSLSFIPRLLIQFGRLTGFVSYDTRPVDQPSPEPPLAFEHKGKGVVGSLALVRRPAFNGSSKNWWLVCATTDDSLLPIMHAVDNFVGSPNLDYPYRWNCIVDSMCRLVKIDHHIEVPFSGLNFSGGILTISSDSDDACWKKMVACMLLLFVPGVFTVESQGSVSINLNSVKFIPTKQTTT
jgi:hypothetical protein